MVQCVLGVCVCCVDGVDVWKMWMQQVDELVYVWDGVVEFVLVCIYQVGYYDLFGFDVGYCLVGYGVCVDCYVQYGGDGGV